MNIYIMQMEAIESRIPKEVSGEEYYAKLARHSKLKFTEEECEFFRKFTESNKVNTKLHNAYYHRSNHLTDITTLKGDKISNFRQKYEPVSPHFLIKNDDGLEYNMIKISKLDDNLYLIFYISAQGVDVSPYIIPNKREHYICDGWEEVVGYLVSQGFKI